MWPRGHVLGTPGVFRFVMFGNKLAPVGATELENIRRAVGLGNETRPWPFLKVGDYVEMAEGPLRGLVGRLLTDKEDCRLVLDVPLLQRSVAVTIDRRWVRPSFMVPAAADFRNSGCTAGTAC